MAIEIRLLKSDNVPWGFRLTGGAEFEEPLTVIKICEGSIADTAGLKVGDHVVRINEEATANLTHTEAHDVILEAGYELVLGVRRDEEEFTPPVGEFQANTSVSQEVSETTTETQHFESRQQQTLESTKKQKDDLNLTDEDIAEIISGRSEVLSEHNNVIGCNFNKVDLEESTVLKTIESQTQENQIDLHDKKWSTFLQKPNKPKPKPKRKESEGPQAPPYRVIIKKQKRKTAEELEEERKNKELNSVQEILHTLESKVATELEEEVQEELEEMESISESIAAASHLEAHSEVHMESHMEQHMEAHMESSIQVEESQEIVAEEASQVVGEIISEAEAISTKQQFGTGLIETTRSLQEQLEHLKTRGSSVRASQSLEDQLAQVQQQLMALTQLPSVIQQTLNAVTQQLEKIVVSSTHSREEDLDMTYEENTITEEDITEREVTTGDCHAEMSITEEVHHHVEATVEESMTHEESVVEQHVGIVQHSEEEIQQLESQKHQQEEEVDPEAGLTEEEKLERRLQKEKEHKIQKEFERIRESQQRRIEQRPTNPLTPLERPIILPGGRKWSNPDDACPKIKNPKMSDEKIATTIETFSETLVGRTKGLTIGTIFGPGVITHCQSTVCRSMHIDDDVYRESNCWKVPSKASESKKINFLKYQPPPKTLDHLQRSEVYRLLHESEASQRGITARVEKVLSEQDYYEQTNH